MSAFDESILNASHENESSFVSEDQASHEQSYQEEEENPVEDSNMEQGDEEEEDEEEQVEAPTKASKAAAAKQKVSPVPKKKAVAPKQKPVSIAKKPAKTSSTTTAAAPSQKRTSKPVFSFERYNRLLLKKTVNHAKSTFGDKVPTSFSRECLDCLNDIAMISLERIQKIACDLTRKNGKKNVQPKAVDAAIKLVFGSETKITNTLIEFSNKSAEKMSAIVEEKRKKAKSS